MLSDHELLEVVGDLYDCAIEPQRWPQALEHLCAKLGCPGVSVSLQDPVRRDVRLLANWGFSPEFQKAMAEALPINPMVPSGWYMEIDEPYTGIGLLGREEYFATRFYREVVNQFGYCDAAMTVFAKTSNRFGGISLPHTTAQGEWSEAQLSQVRKIAPHIRRAVTISDLLDARALQEDMLSATLDLLAVGIILVDKIGRIIHANRAGLEHLETQSAFRRDGDYLSTRDPKHLADLREAIVSATNGFSALAPRSGIAVPVVAVDKREYAAWVLPLDAGLRGEIGAPFSAKAAVFIRELGDAAPFPGELFVKRYGITPAECRVLMMMTQGMTPQEASDALGISMPTVKTHLARLFEKTGTRGQPDLMRLVMSALAPASV